MTKKSEKSAATIEIIKTAFLFKSSEKARYLQGHRLQILIDKYVER